MTVPGYGTTKVKALAISFPNAKEACAWLENNASDACPIDCETDEVVW
jgi:disulfide oxidoreductase YuzD